MVLFVEKQWSAAQIAAFTGWSKTTVIDALAELGITREPKAPTKVRYGWKIEGGALVPHVRQQLVIEKMRRLREVKGYSWRQIAQALNDQRIPTLNGKKWDHKGIKIVLTHASAKRNAEKERMES